MDFLAELAFRNLLYQCTDSDGLRQRLAEGPITLYNGFDPTADSLHIGSLVPILVLRRFQLAGHHPIALVGGGTGMIGDPSGKSSERQLNTADTVQEWTESIRRQIEPFLDFEVKTNPARMINNYSWLSELDLLSFLRDVGKHFTVNAMLAKDSVNSRMETGISYTEFSYMILQAYDFLWLRQNVNCELQTGGSDQWGNITAGTDLIRRITNLKAYGYTFPLITKADGAKFGKTEAGSVWLDPERTTPYQFYQFWINANDADVVNYLKIFTFLPVKTIKGLEIEVYERPSERAAQRALAVEVTTMVHGREATTRAENISRALFYGRIRDLTAPEIAEGMRDVPGCDIDGQESVSLVDLLVEANVSPSKRRAREDVQNGAIYLNDERMTDSGRQLERADRLHGQYLVIRRGKKYALVNWR
jgi:tyrosyl-tRNA synthetase